MTNPKPFRFKASDIVEAYRSRGWKASRLTYGSNHGGTGECCLLGIGLAIHKGITDASVLKKTVYPDGCSSREIRDIYSEEDQKYARAAECGFMQEEYEIPAWFTERERQGYSDGRDAYRACVQAGLVEHDW